MLKKFWPLVASIGILASLIWGFLEYDQRNAKAEDLQAVRQSFKQMQMSNEKRDLRQDIRWYEDKQAQILRENNVREAKDLPNSAYSAWKHFEAQRQALCDDLNALMGK
jgi:hypothetical protein